MNQNAFGQSALDAVDFPALPPGKTLIDVLEEIDIVPLTMSLVQITGEARWLDEIEPHVRGPWDYTQEVPDELAARIRRRMHDHMVQNAPAVESTARVEAERMRRMSSVAVGQDVSADYIPLILQQMGLAEHDSRLGAWRAPQESAAGYEVVIVGAGVAGICAAIHLEQAGIPYTVLEKNEEIGGTWWENTYPGCAVDTPNHFYQFSFEPNNQWNHYFSKRQENLDYLRHCVKKYGIADRIRTGIEVTAARYDEGSSRWLIRARTADGSEIEHDARFLVTAVGQLNRPAKPNITGMDRSEGPVVHTAEWNDTEVEGKRVGLIGTAASGVQFACAVADDVERLTIYQRSGNWIFRNPNIHREVGASKKWALDNIPFYAAWYRFQLFWGYADGLFPALRIDPEWQGGNESINKTNAKLREAMLRHMRRELEGRDDLLEKVIPKFPPFGKRVLGDPGWFRMLRRDNVELVVEGIEEILPNGVRTADGAVHEHDVIVLATGFQAGRMLWPMEIVGRGGTTVREEWGDDNPRAFLGVTVRNFPNMFVLYGPNTATGHGGSFTFLAECQVSYMMDCIRTVVEQDASSIEPSQEAHDVYNRSLDEELSSFVWSHPGVRTWYKNASGRITTNQPWTLLQYWTMTRNSQAEDHEIR